jgi:hypothetical protein
MFRSLADWLARQCGYFTVEDMRQNSVYWEKEIEKIKKDFAESNSDEDDEESKGSAPIPPGHAKYFVSYIFNSVTDYGYGNCLITSPVIKTENEIRAIEKFLREGIDQEVIDDDGGIVILHFFQIDAGNGDGSREPIPEEKQPVLRLVA